MSDEQFKQLYNQANAQMPPEFKAFAAALLSSTYDEDKTTADRNDGYMKDTISGLCRTRAHR